MHETPAGVGLGVLAVIAAVLLLVKVTDLVERRLVRAARGLPKGTRLVRVDGILVAEDRVR